MPFLRVTADDPARVQQLTDLRNAARVVDDPTDHPSLPAIEAGYLRYGWDLELSETYLYVPSGADEPVGALHAQVPRRDNPNLVLVGLDVHPEHRRRGHGTAMLDFLLDVARREGRSTVWAGGVANSPATQGFLEHAGFRRASGDARRVLRTAEVDWEALDRLDAAAGPASADYTLERSVSPSPDALLAELVEVTASINDAPMGELSFEDEVFDVARLRDMETAATGRGDTVYRVAARHRDTGAVGGHTQLIWNPLRPAYGAVGDTAVSRAHRGHRLGLRLKIDMMRWLRETQPQLQEIETWNNVDNRFMISVNETLGYQLSAVYAMYERRLTD